MDSIDIEDTLKKLEQLRELYKNAAGTNKKILEIRGKLLKIALDKHTKYQTKFTT